MKKEKAGLSKKQGFIVLIAVMITTIILTVGMGVLNLALREFVLANVGRDSVKAFYAADTGVECAFNYDVTEKDIDGNSKKPTEPFFASPLSGNADDDLHDPGIKNNKNDTITCNGQTFETKPNFVDETASARQICGGRDCSITYLLRSNNPNNIVTSEDALCLEYSGPTPGKKDICTGACVMMEVRKISLEVPGNINTLGTQETQIIANGINDCDGDRKVERSLVLTWGAAN